MRGSRQHERFVPQCYENCYIPVKTFPKSRYADGVHTVALRQENEDETFYRRQRIH